MEVVKFFFTLQHQIKLYHWQTSVYARHIASDTLGTGLAPLIDRFMEVLQGKLNRRVGLMNSTELPLVPLDDKSIIDFLQQSKQYLESITKLKIVRETDTDLLNIRDEMVGLMNQTLYLFSFQ